MLLSLRAKGDGSERARPCLAGAAGGGACSLLSRSVVSETSEKATAPTCGTGRCGPKMQVACAEFVAERLAGRGKGGGADCAGPLLKLLPFPSVGLGGGPAGRHRGRGVALVPTDGGRECSPLRMQGNEGNSRYACVGSALRSARERQHGQTAG